MRFNSIPALAAVLILGASGVLSRVIPATRGVESTAHFLAREATLCIKDFCATKGDEKQTRTQCGPVVLTVTHRGAPSSVEECVSQFSNLIAQDTESGTSRTEDTLYEISVEDDTEPAANEKRAVHKKKKAKTTKAKKAKAKTTKAKKTKAKKTKAKTPKACPLPKKGKNGKTIQRRCADDEFYKKRDLLTGKVTHWKFNTMGDIDTYNADANAKEILTAMKKNGQLDVVKISSGDLTVVGNVPEPGLVRGTDPNTFTKKGGNYLLTNGGFFQHMETWLRSYEPAGEDTMNGPIDGLKGTRVHSGPDLKKSIPEIDSKSGIWKYDDNDPILVGRLSHASQDNERLALVRFGTTYYSVAYTCKEKVIGLRGCGFSTNKFKKIIDLFFTKMGQTGKSIHSSTQAVCLDGGPSISMTWNEGHRMEKLSLGGAGDTTPLPSANGRRVSNLIKIVA
ncbi:hypothetical protein P171DRAFT_471705 [Karstenula rhodostoma CBS 690.94]|uniref:Phosphodiester glycosidase domain-containing protein n=1 Tax=Karstenula rhodostoma CBS 690.94 TaxID=1392251 RepID=A0A9P4UD89_9PLEO|nr:hypothetical protein P171DRAFT_471705 [Karstenula rhodostoma CBS 690.94]